MCKMGVSFSNWHRTFSSFDQMIENHFRLHSSKGNFVKRDHISTHNDETADVISTRFNRIKTCLGKKWSFSSNSIQVQLQNRDQAKSGSSKHKKIYKGNVTNLRETVWQRKNQKDPKNPSKKSVWMKRLTFGRVVSINLGVPVTTETTWNTTLEISFGKQASKSWTFSDWETIFPIVELPLLLVAQNNFHVKCEDRSICRIDKIEERQFKVAPYKTNQKG